MRWIHKYKITTTPRCAQYAEITESWTQSKQNRSWQEYMQLFLGWPDVRKTRQWPDNRSRSHQFGPVQSVQWSADGWQLSERKEICREMTPDHSLWISWAWRFRWSTVGGRFSTNSSDDSKITVTLPVLRQQHDAWRVHSDDKFWSRLHLLHTIWTVDSQKNH